MIEDAWRIVGGRPLRGAVTPAGSKNGSLPSLAAAILLDGETVLQRVPRIADTETMIGMLQALGLEVVRREDGTVRILNRGLESHRVPLELASRMRASHYLLGPVLARLGRAEIPFPGGCAIGERPLGYILSGLEALGAQARVEETRVVMRADRLVGARVALDPAYRSPGATFNLLMAAVLAEGETVIEHASFEPDVVVFCRLLTAAGAEIEGVGGPRLTIRGVPALKGVEHAINLDRLEAGTFFCAAVATRGEVTARGITRGELAALADSLEEIGATVAESPLGTTVACPGRPRSTAVVTEPFPGFPTDLQPPFAAVLATAKGASTIREGIFGQRLQYVSQLIAMGANIRLLDSRQAVITGVDHLRAAEVEAQNIRDGAALVVAALGAEGESIVGGRRFVARGYQDLEDKLRSLGAWIELLD